MSDTENHISELTEICRKRLISIYSDKMPEFVRSRVEKETAFIADGGYAEIFIALRKVVMKSKTNGYPTYARGYTAQSPVAFLTGISDSDIALRENFAFTLPKETPVDLQIVFSGNYRETAKKDFAEIIGKERILDIFEKTGLAKDIGSYGILPKGTEKKTPFRVSILGNQKLTLLYLLKKETGVEKVPTSSTDTETETLFKKVAESLSPFLRTDSYLKIIYQLAWFKAHFPEKYEECEVYTCLQMKNMV